MAKNRTSFVVASVLIVVGKCANKQEEYCEERDVSIILDTSHDIYGS